MGESTELFNTIKCRCHLPPDFEYYIKQKKRFYGTAEVRSIIASELPKRKPTVNQLYIPTLYRYKREQIFFSNNELEAYTKQTLASFFSLY